MIVDLVRGDVFMAPERHVAFAVNTQGYNDAGFAGQVSDRYWPGLADTGGNTIGDVMSREVGDRAFHALVCHSLDSGGWDLTPGVVEACLRKVEAPADERIAVVLMGSAPAGRMLGADVYAILGALARSERRVVVYTR